MEAFFTFILMRFSMGATSVTGTGTGDSHGEYKPELQCGGCGCGSFTEEEEERIIVRRGCVTKYRSSNTVTNRSGGSITTRGC